MGEQPVSARNYVVVTAAYWSFTLTDGALRMVVLLHFHALGYTPLQLATLFLLYEVAGVVTNFFGGVVASRVGLRPTLLAGLSLQVAALVLLSGLSVDWPTTTQVMWIVFAQGVSGVAKDLTKVSAKSAIKLVVPAGASGTLFRWVALLTGSKNALKGLGFFIGGALLATFGFHPSLWGMAAALGLATGLVALSLPRRLGSGRPAKPRKLARLWAKSRAVNALSAARVFLFGARDVWFVVALPVFLGESLGWSFERIGATMAGWVIGYGGVQTLAPRLLRWRGRVDDTRALRRLGALLALTPIAIVGGLYASWEPASTVLGGLVLFGVLFAMMSSLHSYLILEYSEHDDVAASVGFYYMANAAGRLLGTVLSGAVYQMAGLAACLLTAAAMLFAAWLAGWWLPAPDQGGAARRS
ncbi:MAG: organoarsenical effux MFS transporter ArsJ [Myxococcales bacterium FL481]|nr:MAG: organoarsenical effux MFS transporter ArsJ [Myxococcales bacterium FL481]